jgi:hypothetical protein
MVSIIDGRLQPQGAGVVDPDFHRLKIRAAKKLVRQNSISAQLPETGTGQAVQLRRVYVASVNPRFLLVCNNPRPVIASTMNATPYVKLTT